MTSTNPIKLRFDALAPMLDERSRRLVLAAEAKAIGYGGVAAVARATGVSRPTITAGLAELNEPALAPAAGRVRRPGGGRKPLEVKDPALVMTLQNLVEATTRGDPESPLRWTCKSVRTLAAELRAAGHGASPKVVMELLHEMGYSLQGNKKTLEGATHPDRDAQFMHLNEQVQAFSADNQPVISVDTKKKELVGDFKNAGRQWRPQGQPERVRIHDFALPELGRASPYGVYDLAQNTGWVNVGCDHDTATFAVESIRRWWQAMGQAAYPGAQRLLITADGGGSNGSRVRLWKTELQKLADQTGLDIMVCHLPPGTSKWNKIEHRLFAFITLNWRGQPLVSYEAIISLIAATKTRTGLRVSAQLDTNSYPTGVKVSDAEMAVLNITPASFHGEWNYMVQPRVPQNKNVI